VSTGPAPRPSSTPGSAPARSSSPDDVVDHGWALVATDYVGLGAEGDHPYLVGEPEARSVLDAVLAARQLDDIDLADQTVVWGHSQGGRAALWTGQIAPDYAPDTNVLGVAALAPASDVAGLISNLGEVQGGSIFASYALVGYSSFYDDVAFDDYVRPTARTVIRETAARCLNAEILPSALASVTTGMSAFSRDPTSGPLAERLTENVPTGPYDMPLFVGQGEADSLVLPDVQAAFVANLCQAGNDVDYRTYAGRDHVPLVELDSPLVPELIDWTQQRFDERPFTGNCRP
jgi:pimeloyl-ACP methyl ester carboxylesterase